MMCGGDASPERLKQATIIVEAEFTLDLVRVAQAGALKQIAALARTGEERALTPAKAPMVAPPSDSLLQQKEDLGAGDPAIGALQQALSELTKIERYERRALGRRQRAIRRFAAEASPANASGRGK